MGATDPPSSSAAVIINSATVTAGEADVNSDIRFQSACTVSTHPRCEEVAAIRIKKKSHKRCH